jgi:YaiO family outer membrane protein
MTGARYLIIFSLTISFFCFSPELCAQERAGAEAEYLRIKDMAFKGDYQQATMEARKLLKEYPSYGDARVLLGRILAWQKEYDQALAVIDTLLLNDPDNADALEARKDISQWSKGNTPVATDVRAGYSFDSFNDPYNRFWQVFSAGAGHRFKWGTASAGINAGNLRIGEPDNVNDTELQFEAEAWPGLTSENYAYLSYAYSPGHWFPRHRAAAEIWQVMPEGWAVSAGLKYYRFDRNDFIASLSVEKYAGKFWLSAKGYLYFKEDNPTSSFYFNIRKYFNETEYLQLTLGTGTAPDEPFDIQTDLMRLSANSIRLAYYFSMSPKLMIRTGAGYSREEYAEDTWRNRFEGNISFIYAIKMK